MGPNVGRYGKNNREEYNDNILSKYMARKLGRIPKIDHCEIFSISYLLSEYN
jgi:hypothetical protein